MRRMLVVGPAESLAYFLGSVLIVYATCYILGRKRPIRDLITAHGFGGIFGVLISLALAPGAVVDLNGQSASDAPQMVVTLMLLFALAALIAVFYGTKYGVVTISELFGFSIPKSLLVWVAAFIPTFAAFNALSKLP